MAKLLWVEWLRKNMKVLKCPCKIDPRKKEHRTSDKIWQNQDGIKTGKNHTKIMGILHTERVDPHIFFFSPDRTGFAGTNPNYHNGSIWHGHNSGFALFSIKAVFCYVKEAIMMNHSVWRVLYLDRIIKHTLYQNFTDQYTRELQLCLLAYMFTHLLQLCQYIYHMPYSLSTYFNQLGYHT